MTYLKKTLPLFSYLFHPLFASVYAVLLYFAVVYPILEYRVFYVLLLQIIIITILLPVTFYYLLLSMRLVDSVMLEKKRTTQNCDEQCVDKKRNFALRVFFEHDRIHESHGQQQIVERDGQ